MMGKVLRRVSFLSLVVVFTASETAIAQAEYLVRVYDMPNGDVTFIDLNSIQQVGASKRYWEITKLASPDQYRVVLRRTYMEVDCNARMRGQRAYVDYDAGGTVVASDGTLDRPIQWRPIVPGSNGELVRLYVCSR